MIDMSQRYEHYRLRFRTAMDARGYTNEGLAEKLGSHPVTVSKLRIGTLKLSEEWRANLALALGIPEAILFGEEPLPEPRPFEMFKSKKKLARQAVTMRPNLTLPLFGLAAGAGIQQGAHSMSADPVDEVPCPPGLMNVLGAYALKTRGESMIPRYFPDDTLYVNPNQRVRAGDHAIIQTMLHDSAGTETWVKRFDGEDGDVIRATQYNPLATIEFRKRFLIHVHRVLPVNELFP